MTNSRKNNIFFVALIFVVVSIFVFLFESWYQKVENTAIKAHQSKQLEIARTLQLGLRQYIDLLTSELGRIHHELIENNSVKEALKYLDRENLKRKGLENIYRINGSKIIPLFNNNFTLNKLPGLNDSLRIQFINIGLNKNIYSVEYLIAQKFFGSNGKKEYLIARINVNKLIQSFLQYLDLSREDFVWVLDGKGFLIYHPIHPKMLMRNIFAYKSRCSECHSSFKMHKNMLRENSGTGEYKISTEAKKIMAYHSLKIANIKWVISVSTLFPAIIKNIKSQTNFLMITSIIVFGILLFLIGMLYWTNINRVKAMEREKQLLRENELMEKLSHISRLASIGEMVDSVAHEVNTPLGIIAAQADAILLDNSIPESCNEELKIIKNQALRISEFTRSLLSYSKRLPFKPEYYNIHSILEECLSLLKHRINKSKIHLTKEFNYSLNKAYLDKLQIEQVFLNVLNNAIDAAGIFGTIIIKIKDYSLKENHFRGVLIQVLNNGKLLQEKEIEKVFEPFFSTKQPGKGSGLGLYISRKIIEKHKGKIFFEVNNSFTICNIILPYHF